MIRLRVTPKPRPLDYNRLPPDTHVRSRDVAFLTGYSDEYVRRKAGRDKSFPQPVPRDDPDDTGPRFWRLGDVLDYLKRRGKRIA